MEIFLQREETNESVELSRAYRHSRTVGQWKSRSESFGNEDSNAPAAGLSDCLALDTSLTNYGLSAGTALLLVGPKRGFWSKRTPERKYNNDREE